MAIKVTFSAALGTVERIYPTGNELVCVSVGNHANEWAEKLASEIGIGDELGPFCVPGGGTMTVEAVEEV